MGTDSGDDLVDMKVVESSKTREGRRGTIPKISKTLRKKLLANPLDDQARLSRIGDVNMDEGQEVEPQSQWLNMDVRNLNADVLGQSVFRPFPSLLQSKLGVQGEGERG